MDINRKYHKLETIGNWKKRGVIHVDFDLLYELYINTLSCQHCGFVFENTVQRQLDHEHDSGKFRLIICKGCNNKDRYINFPNGKTKEDDDEYKKKWYLKNRELCLKRAKEHYEKKKEYRNTKTTCICGKIIANGSMNLHKKSKRHLDSL